MVSFLETRRGANIFRVGGRIEGIDCPKEVWRVLIASILRFGGLGLDDGEIG
jgi:hypothetical protein